MSETFYFPDGSDTTDPEEFIKFYSRVYCYQNQNLKLETKTIPGLLYGKNGLNAQDLITILKWKTGAKRHEGTKVKARHNIDVAKLMRGLTELPRLKESEYTDEKLVIDKLADFMEPAGMGAVYAITLLFFLSNGHYPIYDKYAHAALIAITKGHTFDKSVKQSELDKKFRSSSAQTAFKSYQDDYIRRLEEIPDFKKDYQKKREIDMALWAYGHLFYKDDSNSKK